MAETILLKNGLVYDGTGAAGVTKDIRMEDGLIKEIAEHLSELPTDTVIDAAGKAVAPGIIDSHSHADLDVFLHPLQEFDLCQGVTTEVIGICGLGFVPLSGEALRDQMRYSAGLFGYDPALVNENFSSFHNYLDSLKGAGINVAVCATHNAIRLAANVFTKEIKDRAAYERKFKEILKEAMDAGCLGMSTGLSYYPCAYADTEELIFIAKTLKEMDASFLTHIRYPSKGHPDEALEEMIRVGEESGARIHILHYRTKYGFDAGNPDRLLSMFRDANARGCDFTLETLPYVSGSTFIHAILPGWAVEGGIDKTLARLRNPEDRAKMKEQMQYLLSITALGNGKPSRFGHVGNHPEYSGKFILDVQKERGQEMGEMMLDLLLESELDINYVGNEAEEDPVYIDTMMKDTLTLLRDPLYLCGSDAMPYGEYPHPRTSGAYSRMLRFSREKKIPLEEVIYKLTGAVADRLHMDNIGYLKEGYRADVIVFDPAKVTECSNFDQPDLTSKGMDYVFVGGKIAVKDDIPTGVRNGVIIKKK